MAGFLRAQGYQNRGLQEGVEEPVVIFRFRLRLVGFRVEKFATVKNHLELLDEWLLTSCVSDQTTILSPSSEFMRFVYKCVHLPSHWSTTRDLFCVQLRACREVSGLSGLRGFRRRRGLSELNRFSPISCIDLPDGITHSFGAGYVHEAKASIAKRLAIPIRDQILTVGERLLSNST